MTVHLMASLSDPLGLLVGLLAVPVVILFLLKRRFRDVEVSSNLLWARLMEDVLARAPFRRPTEWLSLALLLLAIAAAALAAAGLRLGAHRAAGVSYLVVLDVSASMGTVDREGERFARARDAVRDLIDGMQEGDDVTLIEAGGGAPRVACHRLDDPGLVRLVLDEVRVRAAPGALPSALGAAVQTARAIAEERGRPEIVVLSDFAGDATALEEVATAGTPVLFVRCGSDVDNAGVVHASLAGAGARGGSEDTAGRLLVTASANRAVGERTLSLYRDDALVDARVVTFDLAGAERAAVFDVPVPAGVDSTPFEVRIEPADAFAADDVLYLGVGRGDPPLVLHVGGADPFVRGLVETFPEVEVREAAPADAMAAVADLARPLSLLLVTEPLEGPPPPAQVELYLGCLPSDAGFRFGVEATHPTVLRWERSDRQLRAVGFENLLIVRARSIQAPPDAQTLLETTAGPQLVRRSAVDREVLVWGSDVRDSNLVLTPAFPLLVRNLLAGALGGVHAWMRPLSEGLRVPAGGGRFQGAVDLTVTAPSGERREETFLGREEFAWTGGLELGSYTVEARGAAAPPLVRHVGMNLLSFGETTDTIDAPDPARFEAPEVASTTVGTFATERPLWRELVALVLVLLLTEAALWSGAAERVLRDVRAGRAATAAPRR